MDTEIVSSVIASDAFQQLVLNYLLPGMGSVLGGMLIFMGKKFAARFNINTTKEEWSHARDVFMAGVRLAEEQGAAYFEKHKEKLNAYEKLNIAANFCIKHLPKMDMVAILEGTEVTLAALDDMGATKKRIGYG